jgi:serine/threonine-protein kinase haspin
MRSHLFTGKRGMFKSYWHNEDSREKNNGHTWAEYIPYTNVLWLKYIFGWLRHQYLKGLCLEDQSDLWFNIPGMSDLNKRFDLRTKKGFDSATEVLVFAVDQGWITNEQIEESGFDTTVLSEESIVAE